MYGCSGSSNTGGGVFGGPPLPRERGITRVEHHLGVGGDHVEIKI